MGGHYPSFDPRPILELIPGLDSIVRFDGEVTLALLLNRLSSRGRGERDLSRPLRAASTMARWESNCLQASRSADAQANCRGRSAPTWTTRAIRSPRGDRCWESRGCPWNCSFCSIRPFYELQGGKLRRLRAVRDAVVAETIDLG